MTFSKDDSSQLVPALVVIMSLAKFIDAGSSNISGILGIEPSGIGFQSNLGSAVFDFCNKPDLFQYHAELVLPFSRFGICGKEKYSEVVQVAFRVNNFKLKVEYRVISKFVIFLRRVSQVQ